jgi:DNA-binding MarR family transcriptional regulator
MRNAIVAATNTANVEVFGMVADDTRCYGAGMVARASNEESGDRPERARLTRRELAAWRGFLRVHAALAKSLDAELVAAHRLPITAYEVLLFLEAAPGGVMRMSELADSVLLSRSGMTRLVDRLEAEGLIERRSYPQDRRGWLAAITDRGRQRLLEARPTHLAGVRERFLSRFSEQELDELASFWERVLPGAAA